MVKKPYVLIDLQDFILIFIHLHREVHIILFSETDNLAFVLHFTQSKKLLRELVKIFFDFKSWVKNIFLLLGM